MEGSIYSKKPEQLLALGFDKLYKSQHNFPVFTFLDKKKTIFCENIEEFSNVIERKQTSLVLVEASWIKNKKQGIFGCISQKKEPLPIIVLSEKSAKEDIVYALKNHVYDFFESPFDSEIIIQSIENALNDRSQYLIRRDEFYNLNKKLTDSYNLIQKQGELIEFKERLSELGEMTASIGHEMATPLQEIIMRSELLKNKIESLSHEKLADGLKKITDSAFRIGNILKGLRTLARKSEDDEFENVDLIQVFNEAFYLCQGRYKKAGIKLEFNSTEESILLFANATQISQVFINLLNNAHDAIKELPERWVTVSISSHQSTSIVIDMIDSGKGIPDEMKEKIFEAFYTTKKRGHGTGLGLSISKKIIERHNGSFSLVSNSKNTHFKIVFNLN